MKECSASQAEGRAIKRSDPRLGEIVYRLSEIKRGEPSSTLFVLPGGYRISLDK
jgi:hypothetical protein